MRELLLGIGLGLGAGIMPGPMLSLVIMASLRGGFPAGLRMACAPLLSDLPVIALALTAVHALPDAAVRALSLAGGGYLLYLGVSGLREARTALPPAPGGAGTGGGRELLRGVVANLLNPHPWLFWITVGAPACTAAWARLPAAAFAFVFGFYLLLVGAKVALAALVEAGRRRLTVRGYRLLLAAGGLLLIGAGAILVFQGVTR